MKDIAITQRHSPAYTRGYANKGKVLRLMVSSAVAVIIYTITTGVSFVEIATLANTGGRPHPALLMSGFIVGLLYGFAWVIYYIRHRESLVKCLPQGGDTHGGIKYYDESLVPIPTGELEKHGVPTGNDGTAPPAVVQLLVPAILPGDVSYIGFPVQAYDMFASAYLFVTVSVGASQVFAVFITPFEWKYSATLYCVFFFPILLCFSYSWVGMWSLNFWRTHGTDNQNTDHRVNLHIANDTPSSVNAELKPAESRLRAGVTRNFSPSSNMHTQSIDNNYLILRTHSNGQRGTISR